MCRPRRARRNAKVKCGLLDVYDAETAAFASSVLLLHEELGTSSKEPSEELRRSGEVARVQSEQGRLALEARTLEHGC